MVRYAWAAQSRFYDPARIALELAADTDEMHQSELLLSGSLLRAIPSPAVVQTLLDQVRPSEGTPLKDIRLWWALLRLGELWLPEALAAFSSTTLSPFPETLDTLQLVVCSNSKEQHWDVGLAGHIKEAGLAVAAALDPPDLVG